MENDPDFYVQFLFAECGIGYAYLPTPMDHTWFPRSWVGAHYAVENPENCLDLCNNSSYCKYWHYDGYNSCSLFSSEDTQTTYVGGSYRYGQKYCHLSGENMLQSLIIIQ